MSENVYPTGKILYHWKNPASREDRIRNDEAKEFIVEEKPAANSGVVIWGKFNGAWSCNPSCRVLVRQLTAELEKLKSFQSMAKEMYPGHMCIVDGAIDFANEQSTKGGDANDREKIGLDKG